MLGRVRKVVYVAHAVCQQGSYISLGDINIDNQISMGFNANLVEFKNVAGHRNF